MDKGWQGASVPGEIPQLTISLQGMNVSADSLRSAAKGVVASPTWRLVAQNSGSLAVTLSVEDDGVYRDFFRFLLRESEHAEGVADMAVAVGVLPTAARRKFVAPDEATAMRFVATFIACVCGGGLICTDLADFLHALVPENTHLLLHAREGWQAEVAALPAASIGALIVILRHGVGAIGLDEINAASNAMTSLATGNALILLADVLMEDAGEHAPVVVLSWR